MKKRVLFITQTAIMLALLIVVQLLTRSLSQFVTGSLVNLILLVSTFVIGLAGGTIVAVISPFLAFALGIGPAFIQIVIFVSIANLIIITVAYLLAKKTIKGKTISDYLVSGSGLAIASVLKTAFLWIGLVSFALPLIPGLKPQQIKVITASFTWPQLITALIGSVLAMMIMPILIKRSDN